MLNFMPILYFELVQSTKLLNYDAQKGHCYFQTIILQNQIHAIPNSYTSKLFRHL